MKNYQITKRKFILSITKLQKQKIITLPNLFSIMRKLIKYISLHIA